MKRFAIILLVGIWASPAPAAIINIPDDYPMIQQGIDVSTDGDTVLVQQGTYHENINFAGKNITVASHYILNNDPETISGTVIDGSQPGNPDTASCVLIVSGEESTATLAGFTLTGGTGTVWRDIHNFLWYREGGGILIELSSPTIRNNIISGNDATDDSGVRSAGGGGIRAGDGNPVIEYNEISFNSGLYGGGIVLNYATGTVRGNLIRRNSGGEDYGGSGIWTYGAGTTLIENNTIVENSSDLDGGGILVWATSITARNNIVYGNSDVNGYPQIRIRPGGSGDIAYCDVEGGWEGEGNIDCPPLFCDSENNNFGLAENSCCVGSGENGVNIGAFDIGCGPTGVDGPAIPGDFFLVSVYPNPFNASTTIRYSLPKQSDVCIEIYNILGQKVATLFEGQKQAGFHTVTWQAEENPSGVYFARLRAAEQSENIKMVLLK